MLEYGSPLVIVFPNVLGTLLFRFWEPKIVN